VRDARAELRSALERAERFLNLAALVSVILAGVGVAIAARRFAARHWDSVAILRCVGATEALIDPAVFVLELLGLAAAGRRGGLLVGYLAQYGLSGVLGQLVESWLSCRRRRGYLILPALATGFRDPARLSGLPPLLRLREVPPLRVLRRDLGPVNPRLLALVRSRGGGDGWRCWSGRRGNGGWRCTSARASTGATVAALALAAWGLVQALGLLARSGRGRLALRAWPTSPGADPGSAVQVVALGLGLDGAADVDPGAHRSVGQLAGQPAGLMRRITF
jgi:putative ABC transport system permease protein